MPTGDGDVIKCRSVPVDERTHPAEKPIILLQKLIEKVRECVFDPFMGSGTTGAACVNLGRKFIGIEIDKNYFDIACKRIRQAVADKKSELPFMREEPEELQLTMWEGE